MRLLRLTVLLIIGIFLIAEPVVHSHPLLPGSGDSELASQTICAICAVGANRAVVSAPAVIAPVIVIAEVVTTSPRPITSEVRVPLSSRAPPAA